MLLGGGGAIQQTKASRFLGSYDSLCRQKRKALRINNYRRILLKNPSFLNNVEKSVPDGHRWLRLRMK